MTLCKEVCKALFTCGSLTKVTEKFNIQTKIEEVYDYVRHSFKGNLPESYEIVYYDPTNMSFVDLDNRLSNRPNPFRIATDCVRLYIIPTTPLRRESADDQIVFSHGRNSIQNQDSLSTDDRLSVAISRSVNPQQTLNEPSSRVYFLLDVKSHQRDIYKSDQFSVRSEKPNGRIARIQGRKGEKEKMLQVLPKLRIPLIAFQSDVSLRVAVVTEEVSEGMRVWYKHPDKGFLPEGYEKDTQPLNPIILQLDRNNVNCHSEFTLSLQMVTKWAKSSKDREEVYRFDDRRTREVHSAETEPKSPRLICVLQRNGEIDWGTFCLSDFIRAPKSSKQRSTSVTARSSDCGLETSLSPERKRSKNDV